MLTEEQISKIKSLINEKKSIGDICNQLKLRPYHIISVIEDINNEKQIEIKKIDDSILNEVTEYELTQEEKNEHANKGIAIDVFCFDCGNKKHYEKDEISEIINAPASNRFLGRLFGRIVCEKCNSPRLKFTNLKGKIILDFRNITNCTVCDDAILISRLQNMNKTNICVLCADDSIDNTIYDERLTSSISICPKCSSPTIVIRNHINNDIRIYCRNYSSKEINDRDLCNWSEEYITKDKHNEQTKIFYTKLRSMRLSLAKKFQLPPQTILKNSEMMVIANKRPNNSEKIKKLNLSNKKFITEYEEEIISLFK